MELLCRLAIERQFNQILLVNLARDGKSWACLCFLYSRSRGNHQWHWLWYLSIPLNAGESGVGSAHWQRLTQVLYSKPVESPIKHHRLPGEGNRALIVWVIVCLFFAGGCKLRDGCALFLFALQSLWKIKRLAAPLDLEHASDMKPLHVSRTKASFMLSFSHQSIVSFQTGL